MFNRRTALRTLAAGLAALFVVAGSALAAELMGTLKKVDVEGRKIVVTPEDGGDDVEVSVNDDTVIETPKNKKAELKNIRRAEGKARVVVTHKDGVASKIQLKFARKKQDSPKD